MPYILYLIILLMGLVWAHLPHTLARFPTDHSPAWTYARLHTVFGLALVYLGIRAFLTLVKHVRGHWDYIWLACDLLLITVVVMLTGGVHSDASLLYLWPILTVLVKRHARGAVGIGLCVLALFVIAAWPKDSSLFEIGKTVSRAFVVVIYTAIAACYAGIEKGRVEEVARLREEVALGEYRTTLSREMHDGIQNALVRIAARLDLARGMLNQDAQRAAEMAVDETLTVRQASDELRYLVRRLRSPELDNQGFASALRDHVDVVAQSVSYEASVEVEGEPVPMPADVEQGTLRIIQEALTNAEKHAQAHHVKVHLMFSPGQFQCRIIDDGVGFDTSQLPTTPSVEGGFGLISMRERATSLDGTLEVTSAPGGGSEITLTAPLTTTENAAAG